MPEVPAGATRTAARRTQAGAPRGATEAWAEACATIMTRGGTHAPRAQRRRDGAQGHTGRAALRGRESFFPRRPRWGQGGPGRDGEHQPRCGAGCGCTSGTSATCVRFRALQADNPPLGCCASTRRRRCVAHVRCQQLVVKQRLAVVGHEAACGGNGWRLLRGVHGQTLSSCETGFTAATWSCLHVSPSECTPACDRVEERRYSRGEPP